MRDDEKYFRQARKLNERLFAFKKKMRSIRAREPIEKKIEDLKTIQRRAHVIRMMRNSIPSSPNNKS